ncbi:MAG: hypothetical protein C0608_06480 [Deltaproteobacteria bacterium]|nr:MAG: hypothetical protein C0608_06480 [Deltaproteobacteria bacterium]
MPRYCVNKNAQSGTRDHEVHVWDCEHGPDEWNKLDLGNFPSCHGAMAKAKLLYPTADGCYYCSRECHTS